MTNVVMLTNALSHSGGGVTGVVRDLAMALHDNGHGAMSVVGVINGKERLDPLNFGAASVFPLDGYGPLSFGFSPRMVRTLRDIHPDVIHVHGVWGYPSWAALKCASHYSCPYLVSPHGMLNEWALNISRTRKKLWLRTVEGCHLKRAGCLIALNENEADSIRRLGFKTPIAIVPNGVHIPETSPKENPAWRDAIPPSTKVLLFLSRLHPKKGLELLLDSWKRLGNFGGGRDWVLVIAGWGESQYVDRLKDQVERLGIAERVVFVGPQFDEDKLKSFRAADGFILPSYDEGLPLAVLEAFALGVPVLMSKYCNLKRAFDTGAAMPVPLEVESMANSLVKFMQLESSQRNLMALRATELVAAEFSWGQVAERMEKVYRWVAGKGERPAALMFD